MWWIICIIIAIAFPPSIIPMGILLVYYLIKFSGESNGSHNDSNQSSSNKFSVKCPYCSKTNYIDGEGNWRCNCGRVFLWRNYGAHRVEDICSDQVIYLTKLLAKLAKADGVVSQDEIDLLNSIYDKFELNINQKKEAAEIFNREKITDSGYEKYLHDLKNLMDRESFKLIIHCMFIITMADGVFHSRQEEMILKAVAIFQLTDTEYNEIKKTFIEDLDEYYKILGCNKSSSDEEIKKSYKKLMMEYHPDRYISKGLPSDVLNMITEKCQQLQLAYNTVMKSRNNSKKAEFSK